MKYLILLLVAFGVNADTTVALDGDLDIVGTTDTAATEIIYEQIGDSVQICVSVSLNDPGTGGGGAGSGWNDLGTTIALSVDDTVATNPSTNNLSEYVKSNIGHSTDYYYAEVVMTEQGSGTGQIAIGVVQGSPAQTWLGNNAGSLGAWAGGNLYNAGSIITSTGGFLEGDVMRIWVRDGQDVWLEYHDGVSGTMIGGGDPDADLTPTFSFASAGTVYLAVTPYGSTVIQSAATLRTKESEFEYFYTGINSPTAWE